MFQCFNFIKTFKLLCLLQDPDSIKTGTKGRVVVEVLEIEGILTGVERALAPTSIDSTSMCVNEFLQKKTVL